MPVVEPDDTFGLAHESFDDVVRPALRPVRLVGEVVVDGGDVDAVRVVVEFDPVA